MFAKFLIVELVALVIFVLLELYWAGFFDKED